ncbi:MAG: AraC family transcriptional regulator [Ruminococcaceae bacterium]|nr:AraC family transcriptional regulator [Oscillospiraceae bacterium]
MEWITGIQNAINYIEEHITEPIDYEELGRVSFSSPFHFQRVFSILCGYTVGEYIRSRRLSLAGTELATGRERVIDVAAKYGYDSPDAFAKAFQKFHGLSPSQTRGNGAKLKAFSRLSIKITLEGGTTMNYRIEEKKELKLVGYKKRFTGTPMERQDQDHNFTCETRLNQAVLQYMAHDCDTSYAVYSNFGDDGYDYHIASWIGDESVASIAEEMGQEIAGRFEELTIPAGTYLVCETPRCKWPCNDLEELYRRAVTELLPAAGYELAEGPEVEVIHWFYRPGDEEYNSKKYVELWLPVRKR